MNKILLLSICVAFLGTLKAQTSATSNSSKVGSSKSTTNSTSKSSSSGSSKQGNAKIGWGELNKNEKRLEPMEIFGDMKKGICMIRTQGDKHTFIAKYSSNLSQTFEKELIIPTPPQAEGGKFLYNGVLYINGKTYLQATFYNKGQESNYLLFYNINSNGQVDSMRQIDKIADVKKHQGGFNIVLSHDSTKMLVIHNEAFQSNEKERLSLKVLDANLKTLWSKTIELPYLHKEFDLSDYDVDNEGNVVFIGKKSLKGSEKTSKINFDYRMIEYYWKEDNVKEYKFDLGTKRINNIYFTFDTANNVMVAGFYNNKNNADRVDGYFYTLIDRKSETVTSKIEHDLEADFAKKYKFATKKGELTDFQMKKIYVSDNGNLNFVAEQDYIVTVCNKYGCYNIYYSNDIIVFNLKPTGQLNWVSTIPKRQLTTGYTSFIGFYYFHDKNNTYFIYNDNPTNLKTQKATPAAFKNPNKCCIMMATIDGNGVMTKKEVPQPDQDNHLAINLTMGGNIGGGNYVVLGRYKNYYRIGIATAR